MEYMKKEYEKQREEIIAEVLDVSKVAKCKKQKKESVIYVCFAVLGIMLALLLMMQSKINGDKVSDLTWGAIIVSILTMVVMNIISSVKYDKLRNEISIEMLKKFLTNRFIVQENENELNNISKYEPEEFIPEEEVEQYLQEMKEIPEEISKEEMIYEEIENYFREEFWVRNFQTFVLEKYGKTLDVCKIEGAQRKRKYTFWYDVYYLKMEVSTKKELYLREIQANYKTTLFEEAIEERRDFSVNNQEIEQNGEKYELTQAQKEILVLIHQKYRLDFKIVIKDGYFMLFVQKDKSITLQNEIKTNYDFVNCIDELIKEFINI